MQENTPHHYNIRFYGNQVFEAEMCDSNDRVIGYCSETSDSAAITDTPSPVSNTMLDFSVSLPHIIADERVDTSAVAFMSPDRLESIEDVRECVRYWNSLDPEQIAFRERIAEMPRRAIDEFSFDEIVLYLYRELTDTLDDELRESYAQLIDLAIAPGSAVSLANEYYVEILGRVRDALRDGSYRPAVTTPTRRSSANYRERAYNYFFSYDPSLA